jgi:hypothetical protein
MGFSWFIVTRLLRQDPPWARRGPRCQRSRVRPVLKRAQASAGSLCPRLTTAVAIAVAWAATADPVYPGRLAVRGYTVLGGVAEGPALRRGSCSTASCVYSTTTIAAASWIVARIKWVIGAICLFIRVDTRLGLFFWRHLVQCTSGGQQC